MAAATIYHIDLIFPWEGTVPSDITAQDCCSQFCQQLRPDTGAQVIRSLQP
ncbi:MAG: hypothetical protein IT585_04445 [candidate division Zixibacteria bacterium]|nr:hypothetical protein [candidate division Zixibacteria bacterium]